MIIPTLAKALLAQLQQHTPKSVHDLPEEDLRLLIESCLQRLDLVSRTEFDAQQAVLQRTRFRLEALEAELEQLTQQLTPGN